MLFFSLHLFIYSRTIGPTSWLHLPVRIYLLKLHKRNTRIKCDICSKLTIKTLARRQWRRSEVFIVNFEHILHLTLVFLFLTLNMYLLAELCLYQYMNFLSFLFFYLLISINFILHKLWELSCFC